MAQAGASTFDAESGRVLVGTRSEQLALGCKAGANDVTKMVWATKDDSLAGSTIDSAISVHLPG